LSLTNSKFEIVLTMLLFDNDLYPQ
jgi:hypothetical protein